MAASVCAAVGAAGPGRVAYRGGYSLVGLPAGTSLAPGTPLSLAATVYGWLDQGAGGRYSSHAGAGPVEAGRGYWAWSPCPRLVDLATGAGPAPLTLALGAYRASMVGNPSAAAVTVSGHDYAARWDPTRNGGAGGYHLSAYREPQSLAVGEGIWVFSYRDTTVTMR